MADKLPEVILTDPITSDNSALTDFSLKHFLSTEVMLPIRKLQGEVFEPSIVNMAGIPDECTITVTSRYGESVQVHRGQYSKDDTGELVSVHRAGAIHCNDLGQAAKVYNRLAGHLVADFAVAIDSIKTEEDSE